MKTKITSALVALLFVPLFAGCASTRHGSSEATLAGWVTAEKSTYSEVGPMTIGVDTSELVARKNTSGGRVRFLWGLFTIADD
ncbi:MAG TPA: hypothetical protein DIV79_04015 [Opitutae bacterium]|nr:hypothetical protein [Opitutaceae bacterium]HCR29164.1 hypothetical protein [Opitutae bacterium]